MEIKRIQQKQILKELVSNCNIFSISADTVKCNKLKIIIELSDKEKMDLLIKIK